MGFIKVGVSGWTYPRWRKVFYPQGMAVKNELFFASRIFNTVEINCSFYRMQSPEIYRNWYEQTPPDFTFSVKGSRFITHMKKLKDVEIAMANFYASGVLELKNKLGPVLWQLSPSLKFDRRRMEDFIQILPRTVFEAYELSHQHDERIISPAPTHAPALNQEIRYVFEVRHESFKDPAFIQLLRDSGIALAFADTGGRFFYDEDLTADFVYVRLHGDQELYTSGYDDEALEAWARRIQAWHHGKTPEDAQTFAPSSRELKKLKDVYVYFDNDAKVHAPFDAISLAEKLAVGPKEIWEKEEFRIR